MIRPNRVQTHTGHTGHAGHRTQRTRGRMDLADPSHPSSIPSILGMSQSRWLRSDWPVGADKERWRDLMQVGGRGRESQREWHNIIPQLPCHPRPGARSGSAAGARYLGTLGPWYLAPSGQVPGGRPTCPIVVGPGRVLRVLRTLAPAELGSLTLVNLAVSPCALGATCTYLGRLPNPRWARCYHRPVRAPGGAQGCVGVGAGVGTYIIYPGICLTL